MPTFERGGADFFAAVDPAIALALFLVSLLAGFINTLAGGGSLLTLPALMLLGLPASVANGTNRVGVVAQSLTGVLLFARAKRLSPGPAFRVVLPTLAGGGAGAAVATLLPDLVLEPVMLVALVAVAFVFLRSAPRPSAPVDPSEGQSASRSGGEHGLSTLGLVAAGFYGGFVQAGVGFVLLAVLHGFLRYGPLEANALKLVSVLFFSLASLFVFAWSGAVSWQAGGLLTVGSIVGAQLGTRFSLRISPHILRRWVLAAVLLSCAATALRHVAWRDLGGLYLGAAPPTEAAASP